MFTLILVEDHVSFREALQTVIDMEDDLAVVGQTARGDHAGTLAAQHSPHVAVVDLDLPSADGVTAIADIRRHSPGTACIVLTALSDEEELGRAVEAGAAAILHKSVEMSRLLDAIRRVGAGGSLISANDTKRWLRARGHARERHWRSMLLDQVLSPREREVLELLVQGGTNRSIAADLGISPETVQTHVRNLLAKLDVGSRLEAVSLALRLRLVDPPS